MTYLIKVNQEIKPATIYHTEQSAQVGADWWKAFICNCEPGTCNCEVEVGAYDHPQEKLSPEDLDERIESDRLWLTAIWYPSETGEYFRTSDKAYDRLH